jgi:hypothetical protein
LNVKGSERFLRGVRDFYPTLEMGDLNPDIGNQRCEIGDRGSKIRDQESKYDEDPYP